MWSPQRAFDRSWDADRSSRLGNTADASYESAIDRGATIVVTRGVRHWEVAAPRLYDYPFLVRTNTARIARISPGNGGEEGFGLVRTALAGLPR